MTYLSSAPAGQGPGKGLSHVQTRRKFALFGLGFACLFLLAFPVAESLERLQHIGWLPVFWSLP